ncbi:hypothetical protein YC2023_055895 [Brassica napus]
MREARCFENKERETSILFFVFSLQRRKERGDRVDDESPRCSSSSILLIGGSPRRFFSSVALLFNDGGYGGGIKSVALSEDDNRRLLLIAIERTSKDPGEPKEPGEILCFFTRKNFKGSWRNDHVSLIQKERFIFSYGFCEEVTDIVVGFFQMSFERTNGSEERTSCSAHVLYMYKLLCSRSTVNPNVSLIC